MEIAILCTLGPIFILVAANAWRLSQRKNDRQKTMDCHLLDLRGARKAASSGSVVMMERGLAAIERIRIRIADGTIGHSDIGTTPEEIMSLGRQLDDKINNLLPRARIVTDTAGNPLSAEAEPTTEQTRPVVNALARIPLKRIQVPSRTPSGAIAIGPLPTRKTDADDITICEPEFVASEPAKSEDAMTIVTSGGESVSVGWFKTEESVNNLPDWLEAAIIPARRTG